MTDKASKAGAIPEYTIKDGMYIFKNGISIPNTDILTAVNSINSDLKLTLEETTGKKYELIILERRYAEAIKRREAEAEAKAAEEKKKLEKLEKAKTLSYKLEKEGKLFFLNKYTGKTSNTIPDDLVINAWNQIVTTYECIKTTHDMAICELMTNKSKQAGAGRNFEYVLCIAK